MGINVFFIENAGVITTVEFKGCVAGARIFCIIVGKFSHWKEPSSIILLVIDKNPEIGLYCIVLPLSLAVSLGVEGGGKSLFNL